jgi:hypothetical protein
MKIKYLSFNLIIQMSKTYKTSNIKIYILFKLFDFFKFTYFVKI